MVVCDIFWDHDGFSFAQENNGRQAGNASRFLLFDARPHLQEAFGQHQYAPGGTVSEDPSNLTLKFCRTAAELCAKFAGERPQTFITDLKTDLSHGGVRRPATVWPGPCGDE